MTQRFKRVKYLIKEAKKMGIDVSADDNIKAFKSFLAGDSTYTRAGTKAGHKTPVSLIPFCVNGYTTKYIATISGRSLANMGNVGLSEAKLNIDAGTTAAADNANKGKKQTGYAPPKAHVFVASGTVTTPKSQILLLEYKRLGGAGYTYPYGKADVAGQRTDLEMRGFIYSQAAKGAVSVSFTSERPA